METAQVTADLPIIDLYPRFGEGGAARRAVAEEIARACETVGFFYLRDHGLPQETTEAARDATEAFFACAEATKMGVVRQPGTYRGYIAPMRFSSNADGAEEVRYEAFLVGPQIGASDAGDLVWPNRWPAEPASFAPAIEAYYDGVSAIADALVRCFGLALADDDEALTPHFRRPMTNISLLHYFPRPPRAEAEDDNNGHHDTNCVTILLPDPIGGLEVMRHDGRWASAPPVPGCFTCNIGTMLALWSGGRFRSTRHRVHPPRGQHRYSIAYFASPDYETVVEPLDPASRDGTRRHAGEEFAAFVGQFDRG